MIHNWRYDGIWERESLLPFDEMILSWNAERPSEGNYLFYVSVKVHAWSSWFLYASWGKEGQSSYQYDEAPVKVFQDTIDITKDRKATGFRIKVEGTAPLDKLRALHVYINCRKEVGLPMGSEVICLTVPGVSQMILNHPRSRDLCSPTSTAVVVQYLTEEEALPIEVARMSRDEGFDIFGNWVLNVAEAASRLGPEWCGWVERLRGFEDIYQKLQEGIPVVVSVRGPLEGSALPYEKGHLLVVRGYNPQTRRVFCMDPGFPSDLATYVSYDLENFEKAWDRRGKIAYIFSKNKI